MEVSKNRKVHGRGSSPTSEQITLQEIAKKFTQRPYVCIKISFRSLFNFGFEDLNK